MTGKQITDVPHEHYAELYKKSDALEIAARTALDFDNEKGRFTIRVFGMQYYVNHPVFSVYEASSPEIKGLQGPYEEILLMRYLLEGKFAPASEKEISYEEFPSGAVYNLQFDGRVLGRLAAEFGKDPGLLKTAVESIPGLSFESLGGADAGYRIEFLNGFFVSVLVWEGDSEFPSSGQMLFSENFKYAFSAEDMAVVGDIVITRLKKAVKATAMIGE